MIEFLELWEKLHNPDFNPLEFEGVRKQAGANAFTMSPKKWIEATGALGIVSKAGRYASKDSRIQVIDQKNAGYGAAVNRGLDAANGKYIAVVEPDDYIRKDMFEVLYKIAEETEAEVVKGDYSMFTGEKSNREFTYVQIAPAKEFYGKVYDSTRMHALFYVHMTTWTGIYAHSFLKKHNIRHNESPGAGFQDNGFWFQVFSYAKKVYLVNDDFYRYRVDNADSSINSGTGSFKIFGEYQFIHDFLDRNPNLKKDLIYTYSFFRFDNYLARYYQTEPKYREKFALQFAQEYKEAQRLGEIKQSFFIPILWEYIEVLLKDPISFAASVQKPFPEIAWAEVMERLHTEGYVKHSILPECEVKILRA